MSAATQPTPPDLGESPLSGWAEGLELVICEHCGWRCLRPAGEKPRACPHCCHKTLTAAPETLSEAPYPYPPELVVPFSAPEDRLEETIRQFARGIPYAPADLSYASMRARLLPVYLPQWLVDSRVRAYWQAEAGFNYEVISHQEKYEETIGGSWKTQQVREQRIRWEPRVGRLDRVYQNVTAPAVEQAQALRQQLGDFHTQSCQGYRPGAPLEGWVRLPDRSPQDAWSDAAAEFSRWAAGECQQAAGADHLRQFKWKASFSNLNWTLMLLPVYTTYYLDDDNQPQPILIHGQSGAVTGQRRSSMKRAQQTALVLLMIGLILSVLGLLLGALSPLMPLFAPFSAVALVAGLPAVLSALIPIGIAWDFNRRQAGR